MRFRSRVANPVTVEIRGESVTLGVVSPTYTRGERYVSDVSEARGVRTEAPVALQFVAEHVETVSGCDDYPADLESRAAWWAESVSYAEAVELAGVVLFGDVSGKSVRRVSTQS